MKTAVNKSRKTDVVINRAIKTTNAAIIFTSKITNGVTKIVSSN